MYLNSYNSLIIYQKHITTARHKNLFYLHSVYIQIDDVYHSLLHNL